MQNKKTGAQRQIKDYNNQSSKQNQAQPNTNQGDMMENQQNISLEQLQQLMKDPQIAKFIQEQVQLQERGGALQQISRSQGDKRQKEEENLNEGTNNSNHENITNAQLTQNTLKCNDSNMNSDTSQEILQYQREWAKKFNDHVAIQKSGYGNVADTSAYSNQNNRETQNERRIKTSSELDAVKSYQQVLKQEDDSQEQIALLPPTAFVDNNTVPVNYRNSINFYAQERNDTEHSGFPEAQMMNQHNNRPMISQNQITVQNQEELQLQSRTRNIMNGGKQLTLMTDCSDIIDYSAEVILDNLQEDSQASQKGEEDEYLTFQLCEGEEMNEEMSNFIVLHMLNDGCLDGEEQSKDEQKSGLTYECPKTGSHFDFTDLNKRLGTLKQKRNQIDEAMNLEDEKKKMMRRQHKAMENFEMFNNMQRGTATLKMVEESQAGVEGWLYWKPQQDNNKALEKAKQKQLQKQKKLKAQVQNIIKSAQQDENEDDNLNDSLQQDDEVLSLEDEDHFQTYNVTRNMNIIQSQSHKIPQKHINEGRDDISISQQYNQSNISKKVNSSSGKSQQHIYNTHDGRQKQQQQQQQDKKNQQYQMKTQNDLNQANQKYYVKPTTNQQLDINGNRYVTQPSQISTSYHSTSINKKSNTNQTLSKNKDSQQMQHGQAPSTQTSKISQFSKQQNQQIQNNNKIQQQIHDQQQQMIMNLRQGSQSYHTKPGGEQNKMSSQKYKQPGKKQLGNLGLSQNSISFQNQGVGTMIHSNQLSSMVATNAQNSNQVNTEVVSQRGDNKPSWNESNFMSKSIQQNASNKYQQNQNIEYHGHTSKVKSSKPQTAVGVAPYGSNSGVASKASKQDPGRQYLRKNDRIVHPGDPGYENNITQGELKQTAKFGPQLMKAEIPYQTNKMQPMGSNDMSKYQNDVISQKQFQQKMNQYIQKGEMQQMSDNRVLNSKKQSSKNNNGSWTGKGFKSNNPKAQGLVGVGNTGQNLVNMNNIQQNQNQRKNQHINTGGSMIGYNMAKKTQVSVGTEGQIIVPQSCSAKIGSNIIRSVGTSSNYQNMPSNNANSMGRTSDQNKVQINSNEPRGQQQISNFPQSMQGAGKNYNQMPQLNQQYFQSETSKQSHQQSKDATSVALMNSGGQQANLTHHVQSYSFDYRQNKNQQHPKVQSSHYASINSMNNNANSKGRMSSGGDGMTVKISSMNNNRLQDIINEGSSKKVNPSINQMGKILRSFDSHQAHKIEKTNMLQQQKKVIKGQKEEIYGDIGTIQELSGNISKPQVYMKQVSSVNKQQISTQKQPKVSSQDGNTSIHGQYNSNNAQMREEQQKNTQQSSELAQVVKKSQHKKTKSSSNAIYVTQSKAPQKTYDAKQHMQQTDKNINNVRQSYNSMGATNKLRNNTSQNMVAPKMSSAFENPFNQNHHIVDQPVNDEDQPQQFMSGHGAINQPFNNIDQRAKGLVSTKPKRVTAVTREIQSGTSARVNTFDNRGLQANQNVQYQQMGRYTTTNHPNQHMKVQQQQVHTNPQGQNTAQQEAAAQPNMQNPNRSHQSPKQNIYLVNYQGNVQII